ncbi:MAG: zinc ABC transporter substrate-binding protein [Sedimentibacter sp.]|uniref:metal ABC transporter solute-binding protein, Zn/Mn family n=1 Tax=Sedimentibacter sp. TaxID=1960295 RepID=UPI0029825C37|nr:zinc ABC transporter substrate-binding protein [Sedimentibacter sp.]MDW5299679.1 zinc ABC transporter substrate-binding protein [Sedimentibacter sp.]
MKKNNRFVLFFIFILSIVFLFGCSKQGLENVKGDKPTVAVTIVPEKTFVEALCGELVEVVVLVPPGNSPENYEPTPAEIEKFSKASIYFSIGMPTEEANILPNAGDVKVVALQDKVALVYEDRTFESGERDPHIWLSPKRVKVMIEVIADEMGKIDEANKETYKKNADAYIKQLEELDKEIKEALVGVKSKKFIVYHPAFGYLADDYDLEMYALEKEGKEATVVHLQEMIDLAKRENIKAIFYQEEIDSSQSESFAEEIDGKTMQLAPLSADYIENLKKMAKTMAEVMQ